MLIFFFLKTTYPLVDFAVTANHRVKKKKIDEYLDLARKLLKSMEQEIDGNLFA